MPTYLVASANICRYSQEADPAFCASLEHFHALDAHCGQPRQLSSIVLLICKGNFSLRYKLFVTFLATFIVCIPSFGFVRSLSSSHLDSHSVWLSPLGLLASYSQKFELASCLTCERTCQLEPRLFQTKISGSISLGCGRVSSLANSQLLKHIYSISRTTAPRDDYQSSVIIGRSSPVVTNG